MSMFTLVISCLTISYLPWFMDLTFQVSMQYCSLQLQTLLPSPVTSTTGCCFCFSSISSFFLELFIHWSPVAYWAPTNPGSSSFSVLSFCLLRDWGQEKKGTTEDEMAGWHHQLDGLEFEGTPGVGDGQGGLACCDSWGRKESDTTERLNWLTNWLFMRFSRQEYWSGLAFSSPVDHL